MTIPAGFRRLAGESPFSKWAGPFYVRSDDSNIVLGFEVAAHHCNRAGRLHGSMICAAADLAIGQNVGAAVAELGYASTDPSRRVGAGIATISLNTDFVGYAPEGAWIEVHVDVQKAGRSVSFANAYVRHKGERIARASAVFKTLQPRS
jgi:acyl-coenzyme A thioesterase PaaI-like protein